MSKGPKNAIDKGNVVLTPSTATSNSFQAIGDIEPSDIDTTPKPNPLVSKLILVDEKEGRELKNKGRSNVETGQASKKRNKGGGNKSPN